MKLFKSIFEDSDSEEEGDGSNDINVSENSHAKPNSIDDVIASKQLFKTSIEESQLEAVINPPAAPPLPLPPPVIHEAVVDTSKILFRKPKSDGTQKLNMISTFQQQQKVGSSGGISLNDSKTKTRTAKNLLSFDDDL
jgi:hypothetical protein